MKKCINILLYAAFFGILAAQRPIQEYSTIHFNIYPIATYYILSVILGTLILLIRPKLVSPDLPLPDLLLQIAFIVVTTALFIWKFDSIRFLVLALLTEDVYTLIALVFILMGTMMSNDLVWELTDMFNNLMVIPNVIALFALTKMVVGSAESKIAQ